LITLGAVIIAFVVKRRKPLTDVQLVKELELRDINLESTKYHKLPDLKITRETFTSTLGPDAVDWEINMEDITIEKEIGRGAYGIVFKSIWRTRTVALKKILGDNSVVDDAQLNNFMNEIKLMKNLRPHGNVVQMLGIVTNPLCIVTTFYENGSLLDLINGPAEMSLQLKLKIMKGICGGMVHLSYERIVHRDLAARNVLLGKDYEPVVADFGLSRFTTKNASGMTKSDVGPIKWMAPESLTSQTYSTKSDVWMFGVTCWEILARKEPFPDVDTLEVAFNVRDGITLAVPEGTPEPLSNILYHCWAYKAAERPDFDELTKMFDALSF